MISLERFCYYFNEHGIIRQLMSRYGGDSSSQVSFLLRSGFTDADLSDPGVLLINSGDNDDKLFEYLKTCLNKEREWVRIDYNKFTNKPFGLEIEHSESGEQIEFIMSGSADSIFKASLSILESESFIRNPPMFNIGDRIIHNTMNFLIMDYIYDVVDDTLNYVCKKFINLNDGIEIDDDYRIVKSSDARSDRNHIIDSIIR